MSSQLKRFKRPHDQNAAEPNAEGKLQKFSSISNPSFRVLCPANKIGNVTGEGENTVSEISHESGAKIWVEEIVPGCNERVIVIEVKENEETKDNIDAGKQEAVAGEDLQKALMLVFEKMVEGEPDNNGEDEDHNKETTTFVLRLLILSSQVGPLLEKSGTLIKQLVSESGSQIRVLPRDELPPCASFSDELVQISGEVNAVRKALQSVSQLIDHRPRDSDSFSANNIRSHSREDAYPPILSHGGPFPLPAGGSFGGRFGPFTDMLTYRIICSDEKVGGVIGKGGSIVKALKNETGCDIRVLEKMPESDDRVIVILGPAHPDERVCAPQDAVLRVQERIFRAAPETKVVPAKVIVSAHQVGCILGKAGVVISEMRNSTGAYIRILGKDQTPQYAAENEEVVQINGDFDVIQEALFQITTCLRNHYFRDAFPGFQDHGPPFPPSYMGRRELSPPGRYPSLYRLDDGGRLLHGGFHSHDRPDFHQLMSERLPSSAPWGPQGIEGGPLRFGAPQRRMCGFGGGNHQAIITNTTLEMVVPHTVVHSIYGEDGGCLKQIHEISDANITITDPQPGAKETLIVITGTPDQAHAAQSLIQAFVVCETQVS